MTTGSGESLSSRLRRALGPLVLEAMTDGEWNVFLQMAQRAEARSMGHTHLVRDRLQSHLEPV